MPKPLIVLLLGFWFYLAYSALIAGDTARAIIYVIIGSALTAWRFGFFKARA